MSKYVINEEFLASVERLQLILKNSMTGLFGGNFQSRRFGSSCDFTDYREYMPGDDVSKIDWNAYARFEKLYMKLYLDERQVHTKIYIDASRSMDFGHSKKAEKAIELAATFAYLSIAEMNKASIYYIKNNQVFEVITNLNSKDAFYNNVNKLNEIEFSEDCFISDSILPTSIGYGDGLSIVISDFLTDNNYEEAIDYIIGKKRDLLCLQVLAKEELKPTTRGKVHFYDSENIKSEYRKNINKNVAKAYNQALEYITTRIRNYCQSRDASYLLISDNDSINDIFLKNLSEMGLIK